MLPAGIVQTVRACGRRGVAALALALAGCHGTQYAPPPLPAFMQEEWTAAIPPDPCAHDLHTGPCTRLVAHESPAPPGTPPVAPSAPRPTAVTLPDAVYETVFFNLRLQAGAEKVQQARADLLTDSLIPNPTLLYDSLLNSWGTAFKPTMQGGPPQMDVMVTLPIDWFVFGKRAAAMASSKLGVDVAAADFADLIRKRVLDTLLAFYDVLEAKELLRLAREDLQDLQRIETITRQRFQLGGATAEEVDRVRLAVLDSQREQRQRELTYLTARSRLRPLLGRSSLDPEFDIEGTLDIKATAPVPELAEALALAEQQRPDIVSDIRSVAKTEADIRREEAKAYPTMNVIPGGTYQFQKNTIGFPDARSWDVTVTTTVPLTDRNQGNIDKARSSRREALATLQADIAEMRAEVEQARNAYQVSLSIVRTDDPATLETARRVRTRAEEAFKAGGRRLLEVLDAQRAWRDRYRNSITGRAEYWRSLHRLNAALGGRTLETPDVPRPAPHAEHAP
jgi:cobalt-zinc-cadmium efflux system outer membrane protein